VPARTHSLSCALALSVALVAGTTHAQQPPPAGAPAQPAPPPAAAPAAAPPAGEAPPAEPPSPTAGGAISPPGDSRGLTTEPEDEPEDWALLLPRSILAIPSVVLQVVFWPIQHGLRFTERHKLIEEVEDILYNDARTAGIVPSFSFLSSQGPTVGVQAFHDDLGGHEEKGTIDAKFGGRFTQAYEVTFEADRFLGSPWWVETITRYEVQPRLLFEGYGDDAPELENGVNLGPRDGAVETKFRQRRALILGGLGYTFGKPGSELKLGGVGVWNNREFGPTDSDDVSIGEVYDTSQLVGFGDTVKTLELGGRAILDTRDHKGATGSGVYVEVFGGAVPKFEDYSYGHFGGEASVYIDLFRGTRVLVLRAVNEAVGFAPDENIPFSDLPRLGGPNRLRGFDLDRFRDRVTAVGTVEYHYPIHEYVAGSLFIDAGRPAPSYEKLFEMDKWRLGGGGGFIIRSKKRIFFSLDVAYGDGINVYFTTDPLRAFHDRNEQL
jgi:hypothetical protein